MQEATVYFILHSYFITSMKKVEEFFKVRHGIVTNTYIISFIFRSQNNCYLISFIFRSRNKTFLVRRIFHSKNKKYFVGIIFPSQNKTQVLKLYLFNEIQILGTFFRCFHIMSQGKLNKLSIFKS